MTDKFSLEDLLINILPGWFVIIMIWLFYHFQFPLSLDSEKLKVVLGNDFLLTSAFIISSFIVGEILQTMAHLKPIEKFFDIFTKWQRPSEIFLLKNNPVVTDYFLNKLTKYDTRISNLWSYKNISWWHIFWWKNKDSKECQDIFNEIYTEVRENKILQYSNAKYLFTRVLTSIFLLLTVTCIYFSLYQLFIISGALFMVFLYRTRWCAVGLVKSTIILYSNKNPLWN